MPNIMHASRTGAKRQPIPCLSSDDLDAILERTEYADEGVAIGTAAASDQDLRREAQRELGRRMGFE